MEKVFFELLQVAIGKQGCLSHTPTESEWMQLYKLAEKHALLGISFAGVQRLDVQEQCPPQEILFQWFGISRQIEERNELLNKQCQTLEQRIRKDGLHCCLLKGQGNAMMYGHLSPQLGTLRQPGDIDTWVGGGFERVLHYVQGISPTDEVNEQHVHLDVFRDTEVEVHFTPSRLANRWRDRVLQQWFAEETNRQMSHQVPFDKHSLTIPTADFNMVYQLLHIYRHMFSEGIGLRQLMDYYVLLATNRLSYAECDSIRQLVHLFGLDRFAAAIMWILGYVFKLESTVMQWKPDERCGRFLLAEVMQMGNFGHSDKRFQLNSNDSHLRRYWQMAKSKWRFIRYFPCETLWQPIDTFIRFFELRQLKAIAKNMNNEIGK